MQQFFVTADQVQENQIYIEGTDVSEPKEVYLWDRNVISNDSSTSHESKIADQFVIN